MKKKQDNPLNVDNVDIFPEPESIENQDNTYISYNKLSRRDLRSVIFHLLYAAEAYDYEVNLETIIDSFNRGYDLDIPFTSEAGTITQSIIDSREKLDEAIRPLLINWRFERIGVCTKIVLRLAVWELLNTNEPHSVIINEAIELAKCFSEIDAYKFVNGILDEAVKILRPEEQDLIA